MVMPPVTQTMQKLEIGGSQSEASLEKSVKPYLKRN
jgi:hypothetical protein